MKQMGLTQKALAERMYCTQQYVSKILKGNESLSLEMLSKLEDALGACLIADETVASPQQIAEEEEPYGGYYLIYGDRPVLVQKYQAKNAKLTYIPTWMRPASCNLY